MAFLFVFLIGIALIIFNVRALSKEKPHFDQLLTNKVENMQDVEIKLGELRREFTEDIFELQKEIEKLKLKVYPEKKDEMYEEISETVDNINSDEIVSNNTRVNEIGTLLKQGLDIDEVAEKLSIGKGEVLLIKELYLK